MRTCWFKKDRSTNRGKATSPQFGLHSCYTQSKQILQSQKLYCQPTPLTHTSINILATPVDMRNDAFSVCQQTISKRVNFRLLKIYVGWGPVTKAVA